MRGTKIRQGRGKYFGESHIYEGYWRNDTIHGVGLMIW